eukprot:gene6722-12284_t
MSEDRVMLSQNTYTSIKIILPIDVAVAVLTGLANCAFLIMLIKTKSLHKPSFVFLGALSTSDVLVGFVVQPLWIADYSFRVTGNFNENLFYIRGSVAGAEGEKSEKGKKGKKDEQEAITERERKTC